MSEPVPLVRIATPDGGEGVVSPADHVLTRANAAFAGRRDCRLGVLDGDADVALAPDDDGRFRLALVPMDASRPPASALIDAMIADLLPLYGRIDGTDAPSATPADFAAPGGIFLVGWDEHGDVVCGGGLKRLDDATAEIKRMFVTPAARSRGHARRLLRGLEDAARDVGYARVRLDTGPKQPHALALYHSAGFIEIADYNGNPQATYWGEKPLR